MQHIRRQSSGEECLRFSSVLWSLLAIYLVLLYSLVCNDYDLLWQWLCASNSTLQPIAETGLCCCPPAQSIQNINSMPYLELIFFLPLWCCQEVCQCPESCLFHHVKPFITLSQHVLGHWDFCHLYSKCSIPVCLDGLFANSKVALKLHTSLNTGPPRRSVFNRNVLLQKDSREASVAWTCYIFPQQWW